MSQLLGYLIIAFNPREWAEAAVVLTPGGDLEGVGMV
jgi:hypothetical protein